MTQQQKPLGLVLSELVLVVLILGLLVAAVASQLRGTFDANAQALALYNTTQKMAANWNQLAATCGAKSDVIGSPLLAASTNTAADVLTRGDTAVNSRFQKCYHQSHVRMLTDAIQQAGSGQQIQGYRFDLSGGGMAPFVATFHAVPAELTYVLASRYGSLKTASLLPQDTSSLHVRYKPDGKNTYAVDILVGSPTQLAAAPTLIGTTSLSGPTGTPPTGTGNPPSNPPVNPPVTLPLPPGTSGSGGSTNPCNIANNTSTAGPVAQANMNNPSSTQMPINIGGNQQVAMVNNQNCNQLNQNAAGNTATSNGGSANSGNTARQTNNSPTSINQGAPAPAPAN